MNPANLEPRDFGWSEIESLSSSGKSFLVDRLTHTPTGYHFTFDTFEGEAFPYYFPNIDQATTNYPGPVDTWEKVFSHVTSWVLILKNEIIEPDLWAASHDDKKLIAASIDDLQNSPFTTQEQQRIKVAIDELHGFIHATANYSSTQQKFIDSRLRHLEEASSRLGRKDWITLAMGTLTNIVVGVALAPDAARELVRTAGALFGWVAAGVQLIL